LIASSKATFLLGNVKKCPKTDTYFTLPSQEYDIPRIRVRTSVWDPDPYVFWLPLSGSVSQRYRYGSGSFNYQKVNVEKKIVFVGVLKVKEENSRMDPMVRGTDPWIRIRTKCHGSTTLVWTIFV
jgi:hypothetical protein